MSGWLLDTHVLLWSLAEPARLGQQTRTVLEAPENTIYVSPISLWEIEIKRASGKLQAPDNLPAVLDSLGFLPLDVNFSHALHAGRLPRLHADPFDRMLIAQAQTSALTLITADSKISAYGISILAADQ